MNIHRELVSLYKLDIYIQLHKTTVTTYILSDIYFSDFICPWPQKSYATRVARHRGWSREELEIPKEGPMSDDPMSGGYHGVYLIKVYKSSFGDGLLM